MCGPSVIVWSLAAKGQSVWERSKNEQGTFKVCITQYEVVR